MVRLRQRHGTVQVIPPAARPTEPLYAAVAGSIGHCSSTARASPTNDSRARERCAAAETSASDVAPRRYSGRFFASTAFTTISRRTRPIRCSPTDRARSASALRAGCPARCRGGGSNIAPREIIVAGLRSCPSTCASRSSNARAPRPTSARRTAVRRREQTPSRGAARAMAARRPQAGCDFGAARPRLDARRENSSRARSRLHLGARVCGGSARGSRRSRRGRRRRTVRRLDAARTFCRAASCLGRARRDRPCGCSRQPPIRPRHRPSSARRIAARPVDASLVRARGSVRPSEHPDDVADADLAGGPRPIHAGDVEIVLTHEAAYRGAHASAASGSLGGAARNRSLHRRRAAAGQPKCVDGRLRAGQRRRPARRALAAPGALSERRRQGRGRRASPCSLCGSILSDSSGGCSRIADRSARFQPL